MPHVPHRQIDLTEGFPHLAHAPVVEAVIHWQARAEALPDSEALADELAKALPSYPRRTPQYELHFEARSAKDGTAESSQRRRWQGIRCMSEDNGYVAQFTVDGLAVSRMTPYENWNRFVHEALDLWGIYERLAKPSEIQRLGVRYINRIQPVAIAELKEWLTLPPVAPGELDWPVREFFFQKGYDLPQLGVNVNLIQTFQPGSESSTGSLIIDVDASSGQLPTDRESINRKLIELRWAKNKTFFSTLIPTAIEQLKDHAQ